MRDQVLSIAKVLLDKEDYNRFVDEYNKVEKYICRLKVGTQFKIVFRFMTEE